VHGLRRLRRDRAGLIILHPSSLLRTAAPGCLTTSQHLLVLGGSWLLVGLFTYPLILDPGRLMPHHKDPFMYGWTMVSNVHRLLSVPLAVFHGNTFYPHGNTIAYTDLLLTPTLTAGPIYLLTGNPVLQYNLTLLIWWVLSGWAMYVLAFALFRSHAAATIAALGFTLCPFRTDFYLEFQMQLGFPIPLAVLGLLRLLESHRWRHLAAVVLFLWVEALASMYYAIILGLCLAVLTILHAILRPGAWSWRLVGKGLVGALVLGLILGPFLVPYVQNRRELGLERTLRQPPKHAADVLTYLETGVAKLYHFSPTEHLAETSLFMGFAALLLAAVACIVPGDGRAANAGRGRIRGALTLGMGALVVGLALVLGWGDGVRAAGFRPPAPQRFFDAILLLGLARLGLEGWGAARAGEHRGPLGEREVRWVCLFLIVLFFNLSLGPWIHFDRKEVGKGLYYHLYEYLLPLHAIRITSRIGVIVVLGVSLLAGLGMKLLAGRLPTPRRRVALTSGVALVMLAEYHSFPLPYQQVDWSERPAVYRALAADPDDVAVLEWPLGWEYWDDYYTFMSSGHWKRIVNGASGFLPRMTHDISNALSKPDTPQKPFPAPGALKFLLGIHPLRYVVVHNALIGPEEQQKWRRLRETPWAEHVGTFGEADLYRLSGDAAGTRVDKFFSWDYARARKELVFRARAVGPAAEERWLDVELNGRPMARRDIGPDWTTIALPLPPALNRSAPNVVTLLWRYRRPDVARREAIGRTGVVAPVDLYVASGGLRAGYQASVLVNVVEHAQNLRGYNVVAIHSTSGEVLWSDRFDTHVSKDESRRLADAIDRVPRGAIVVAAVKDEGSRSLTDEAVAALGSIGAAEDIRGRYRVSHLVIGVKGGPPGSALEQSGDRLLEVTLGTAPSQIGVEIHDFQLR
jgi:Interleukin-like EMT inducer